jgi:hypothetical protein
MGIAMARSGFARFQLGLLQPSARRQRMARVGNMDHMEANIYVATAVAGVDLAGGAGTDCARHPLTRLRNARSTGSSDFLLNTLDSTNPPTSALYQCRP